MDTPKEAKFRAVVRAEAERGMLLSPTDLNMIMGDSHRYNQLSGNQSKIRIEEFKRVGAIKDKRGHWMVGPERTLPDGRPCWCVEPQDPPYHSAVCRHHQLKVG